MTFGGSAPVTSHRGDDERLSAEFANLVDNSPHDFVNPVDTTAAGGYGYALPRAKTVADAGPTKLLGDRGTNIANLRRIQELAHRSPAW